jgi:hypothetical protein
MSFFDRQGIQDALLRDTSSTANALVSDVGANDRFEDDVITLRDYSFIKVTKNASTFEMHSLVQLATREWLKSPGRVSRWRKQFISNLCTKLPIGEHKDWETCEALFPHVKAALAQRPQDNESLKTWARLLLKAAWYAWQRGGSDEAEHMSVVSMEVRGEVLGKKSIATLRSMAMVGLAKDLGGKYEEAEAMNRQTLAQQEKVLGTEHPDTLLTVFLLACSLMKQHRFCESLPLYQRASAGYHTTLGKDHPTTMACHQHYTELCALQEQTQIALSPATPDNSASTHTGMVSSLSQWLAKLGIWGSKSVTGQDAYFDMMSRPLPTVSAHTENGIYQFPLSRLHGCAKHAHGRQDALNISKHKVHGK